MARYDIIADVKYGDLELSKSPVGVVINPLYLLGYQDGLDNDHYCYLESQISSTKGLRYSKGDSILVQGRYHAINKPIKIRFLLTNGNELKTEYLINKLDNSAWFDLVDPSFLSIPLCKTPTINDNSLFELVFDDKGVTMYSGNNTDFIINESLSQNKNLLLLTRMGNLLRHPLTGVGLIDYLNSNLGLTNLAEKLQDEFVNDGMVIVDASINSETGDLKLTVEE